MTIAQLRPNEFIIVVTENDGHFRMTMRDPHEDSDPLTMAAAYAMVASCKRLKHRIPKEMDDLHSIDPDYDSYT